MLIDAGADVEAQDQEGRTPLTIAQQNDKPQFIELLRQHGALPADARELYEGYKTCIEKSEEELEAALFAEQADVVGNIGRSVAFDFAIDTVSPTAPVLTSVGGIDLAISRRRRSGPEPQEGTDPPAGSCPESAPQSESLRVAHSSPWPSGFLCAGPRGQSAPPRAGPAFA